jgi:hypothetical protein
VRVQKSHQGKVGVGKKNQGARLRKCGCMWIHNWAMLWQAIIDYGGKNTPKYNLHDFLAHCLALEGVMKSLILELVRKDGIYDIFLECLLYYVF